MSLRRTSTGGSIWRWRSRVGRWVGGKGAEPSRLRAAMSVPPLLDLESWSPGPTVVGYRSSAASDSVDSISSETELQSPGTPLQMAGDRTFQLQQLSFQGDDASSPSEDEGEDDETAVDLVAPRGTQLQIHLFPTFATLQDSGVWKVNVHGWCVIWLNAVQLVRACA